MPDIAAGASADDVERGRVALAEITPPSTIGEPIGSVDEGGGVLSLHFAVELPGYPGWRWTATIAHVDGAEPTVLETEMTPGEGALLAPDWIPWVDRLADYNAAQDAAELATADDADDRDDDESGGDDDALEDAGEELSDSDDEPDDSDDGIRSLLHAGDLDGVDIDALDEDEGDEEEISETDAAGSALPADDVQQTEAAEHDPEPAGDRPGGTEATGRGTGQQ